MGSSMLDGTIDFARLGPVGTIRYLASKHARAPFQMNLFALNYDERMYWDDLWLSKPDPIEWTMQECCMFDYFCRVASDYILPWPQNGRCPGMQIAEAMAAVKTMEITFITAAKN